jgi:hypothetical protein
MCEQHMVVFDTTVGTFLGPAFELLGSRATKRWSQESTDSGIEDTMCCSHNTTQS